MRSPQTRSPSTAISRGTNLTGGRPRLPLLAVSHAERPKVDQLLDQSQHVPLTIVVAPAGYGKTTGVASWSARQSSPIGWLTATDHDNNPSRLLRGMLTSLAALDPALGQNTSDLFDLPNRPDLPELTEVLASELLEAPIPITLVIDDAEKLVSDEVCALMDRLLDQSGTGFHLILVGRAAPRLRLARRRGQQALTEIHADDLLLGPHQVRDLFANAGYTLSDGDLETVMQLTTGWPAAVRLLEIAFVTNRDGSPGLDAMQQRAARSSIAEYLLAEILDHLQPPARQMLLACSIVDAVSPSLASALVSGNVDEVEADRLIGEMARYGIVTILSDRGGTWYRIHPLIRDLGRDLFGRGTDSEPIREAHARAFRWFEAEEHTAEAIYHGLEAAEYTAVLDMIERHLEPALEREDGALISTWLALLPPALARQRPALQVAQAWAFHFRGMWRTLQQQLDTLRQSIERSDSTGSEKRGWLAELELVGLLGMQIVEQRPESALERLRELRSEIPPSQRWAHSMLEMNVGTALSNSGQRTQALDHWTWQMQRAGTNTDIDVTRSLMGRAYFERARGLTATSRSTAETLLALSTQVDLPLSVGWAHLIAGGMAYQQDQLDIATRHFTSIALSARRQNLYCVREGMTYLAYVQHLCGQEEDSNATLHRLLHLLIRYETPELIPGLRAVEALIAHERGDSSTAMSWLEESVGLTIETSGSQLQILPRNIIRIRLLIGMASASALTEALELISVTRDAHNRIGYEFRLPELDALEALASEGLGLTKQADGAIVSAFSHPSANGILRGFTDLGPDLIPLLQRSPALDHDDHLRTVLDHSTKYWSARSGEPAGADEVSDQPLDILLTRRERTVLDALSSDRTYREIGYDLFISPLTVKRHVSNIFTKLGASSRREALVKASTMGWRKPAER